MPTAGGPNTLGESNLVFAYDTGDVRNSYIGQPTVNALGTPSTDLFSWVTTGNSCTLTRDTISSPVGNTPLKMVTTGNDPYTNTYNSTGNNITAAASGQTWTISVWAKANQNTTGAIFHFGANSSGNYIDFNATGLSLTTEWTRYTYTRTFTDGNVVAIQARLDGPDSFQSGVTVWWDGLQVEQKAYATQFTTGTRSATQGLLPVIGNSTIDLSNVSFDSNAQIVFDGTNDYINIGVGTGINQFSGDFTVSLWAMRTAGGAYGNLIGDYYTNSTATTGEWQIMMGPSSELTLYKVGPGYVISSISSGFSNNTWINVVVTRSGAAVTMYANSNAIATGTDSTSYGTVTGNLNIGIDGNNSSEPFPGRIANIRIYNRALTAQEVKQNYQQYKTRFNLS